MRNSALIVVDLQRDFVKGGKLPVPSGDKVLPVVNKLIDTFSKQNQFIIFSRDWHPRNHCSFKQFGEHCVANSVGSGLHPDLNLAPGKAVILNKGTDRREDSLSAFGASDGFFNLEHFLQERDITDLYVVGLALDYCVKATALDAVEKGFTATVVEDGTKALTAKGGKQALKELLDFGVQLSSSKEVLKQLK